MRDYLSEGDLISVSFFCCSLAQLHVICCGHILAAYMFLCTYFVVFRVYIVSLFIAVK